MPQSRSGNPGSNDPKDAPGRTIVFNDGTHDNFTIPQVSDIEKMNNDKLMEAAEILAYGLAHGSGANVKLAFPFAYVVAKLCQDGEKNPVNLVRQLEQEGSSARWGTITVNW